MAGLSNSAQSSLTSRQVNALSSDQVQALTTAQLNHMTTAQLDALAEISASGTTILLSLLLGLSRPAATEFSFLVSIPTMLAAGGLKIFKALHHTTGTPAESWGLLLLASAVSAIVSFIAVKWLLRFVQSHTFTGFGWYRIVLGLYVVFLMR